MAKNKTMSGAEPQFAVEAKVVEVKERFHRQRIKPSAPVLGDLRQSLGLTVREMALLLEIDVSYCGGLENGKRPFPKTGKFRDRMAEIARHVDKHGELSNEHLELLTAPSPIARSQPAYKKINIRINEKVEEKFRQALVDSPLQFQWQLMEAMIEAYQEPALPLPDRQIATRAASSESKGQRIAARAAWAVAGLLCGIAAMHFIPQI